MRTVTIATFNDPGKAEPLRRRLEEVHIPAEVHDQSAVEQLWFVKRPVAGVRLKIHAADYERAIKLLREWDATEGILKDAVRCPECGSSRVEYPQFTRKFLLPNLVGLLAAIGLIERKFYCMDCQYTWPRNGRKKSKRRPHMAPYYFIEGVPQARTEAQSGSGAGANPG